MVTWSGFLAPTRAFSKGAPTICRKHIPWGIGTESLGMIGCIFAEKGPLEGGIESSFSGTGWVFSDWFLASIRAFSKGAPTIFRKHMPWGMGTESLGMIGCIFAENGPLEGGIESSFWGTGWGAKGDFRRIFGPDPFIFEGGPPPFSESTCPQVWAQKVWEWSDAYSRRMGP